MLCGNMDGFDSVGGGNGRAFMEKFFALVLNFKTEPYIFTSPNNRQTDRLTIRASMTNS